MSKKYHKKVSEEIITEAQKIANASQKPQQTKEQTKLIAQGIQKGIELYKKQQKAKARDASKHFKKIKKEKTNVVEETPTIKKESSSLPWILLLISWIVFLSYIFLTKKG